MLKVLTELKFKRFLFTSLTSLFCIMNAHAKDLIIDDRNVLSSKSPTTSNLGKTWRLFTDQVMGGISSGSLKPDIHEGRNCLRMKGKVSTENNGGFVQMALSLKDTKAFDASTYQGVRLLVSGNNEIYKLHLRTSRLWLPWQSYRASFKATPEWSTFDIPFSELQPYRTNLKFQQNKIKRLGLVAIGKDFMADLCVASVIFYK